MAAQPSTTATIIQAPYNLDLPIVNNLNSQARHVEAQNTMDCGREGLEFNTECMIDFDSLRANGRVIAYLFMDQQWGN
jgi:hypothetical protein